MSVHCLGLDLGLANAGAAQLHADGRVYTTRYATEPLPTDAPVADVAARIRAVKRWAISRATAATALAVVEELPRGTQMGQHDERAAIVWGVIEQLVRHQVPVALINPTTLKHRIAGNGRADKDRIRRAVAALWPGHGLARVSYDEADAVALATLGVIKLAAHHGPTGPWSGPWLEARSINLDDGCRWPDLGEPATPPAPPPAPVTAPAFQEPSR